MQFQPPSDFDATRPSASNLLWAYRHGVFPMSCGRHGPLQWFCPDPRAVIPLANFHVPGNLRRKVRQGMFAIRSDTAFEQVIRECSKPRSSTNGTWLNDPLMTSYLELHGMGHAHSVEAWLSNRLVGGLYGVHVGGAFFGESMFSRPKQGGTDASKVCLVHLVGWLRSRGFRLLDTQFMSDHLRQFGCVEWPSDDFLAALQRAVELPVEWGPFHSGSALETLPELS